MGDKTKAELEAELEGLKAQNAELAEQVEELQTAPALDRPSRSGPNLEEIRMLREALGIAAPIERKKSDGPVPLDPKYKGTITYRRTRKGYAKGSYFEAGELVTLTDEAPSKTYVRVDAKAEAKALPQSVENKLATRESDLER